MSWHELWSAYVQSAQYRSPHFNRDISGLPGSQPRVADGAAPTVLCLHGFGGVPLEIDLVFETAKSLGLRAVAPLLAGHGTRPSELAALRFEDWLAGARRVFDEERKRGPVILVGLSLGSLLCTELYLSAPGDVLGLGLLANAFWLASPMPARALSAVDWLRIPDFGMPKFASDIGDDAERANHVTYGIQPVHAALSIQKAGERLREQLFRVHCPTLILHGAQDRVCPVQNAWRVAERLGTPASRVVIFPRSHHILTRDVEREAVRRELAAFLLQVSSPQVLERGAPA